MMRQYVAIYITALLCFAYTSMAYAAQKIGVVSAANPSLQSETNNGETRKLKVGDPVFFGEKIITNDKGNAQLIFEDKSTLTIAANSAITVDEFIYDPATAGGDFSATITKGTFRFIGGALSKKKPATFKTPVATIGIHGSSATLSVLPETTLAMGQTGGLNVRGVQGNHIVGSGEYTIQTDGNSFIKPDEATVFNFLNTSAAGLSSSDNESAGIGFFSKPRTSRVRNALSTISETIDSNETQEEQETTTTSSKEDTSTTKNSSQSESSDDETTTEESSDDSSSDDSSSDDSEESSTTTTTESSSDSSSQDEESTSDTTTTTETTNVTTDTNTDSTSEGTDDTEVSFESDTPIVDDTSTTDDFTSPTDTTTTDATINQEQDLLTESDTASGSTSDSTDYNLSLENYIFGTTPWDSTSNAATRDALDPTSGSVTGPANPRSTSFSYITEGVDNAHIIAKEIFTQTKIIGATVEGLPSDFFDNSGIADSNGEILNSGPIGVTAWSGSYSDSNFQDITATYTGEMFGYMIADGTELSGAMTLTMDFFNSTYGKHVIEGSWYLDRMNGTVVDNPDYVSNFYNGHLLAGVLASGSPDNGYAGDIFADQSGLTALSEPEMAFGLAADVDSDGDGVGDGFHLIGAGYGLFYGSDSSAIPDQAAGTWAIGAEAFYESLEAGDSIGTDNYGAVGGFNLSPSSAP